MSDQDKATWIEALAVAMRDADGWVYSTPDPVKESHWRHAHIAAEWAERLAMAERARYAKDGVVLWSGSDTPTPLPWRAALARETEEAG